MVGIAFLAQNCAVVMAAAAYGTALTTFQEELHTTRATASFAIGVMYLALGALSPVAGNMLQRVSLRTTMGIGALMSVAGYVLVARATDFTMVLVAYGLLLGPAACLLGPLAAATLVSRWFEKDRGKALGMANMPLFMLFVPPISAFLLTHGGREMLFLALAGVFVLLFLLTRAVIDHPEQVGQSVRRAEHAQGSPAFNDAPISNVTFLTDGRFWLLNLAVGILTGFGGAYVAHAVPIATSKGIGLEAASTVMSSYGVGTLGGALVLGWLIDRIGALRSLVLSAFILACLWAALGTVSDLSALLLISGLIGAAMGGAVAMHAAAINELFGAASISRGMGLSYFLKIPFLFGCAPLLGHFFDTRGNYDFALTVSAVAVAFSMAIFVFMAIFMQGRQVARSA